MERFRRAVRAATALVMLGMAVPALWVAPAQAFTPPFNLREVAPGVYVHLGKNVAFADVDHDDVANLGLVVGTRCAAVIDTGGSVATGRAFRAAVRDRTDKPVCYVINTHGHPDHVFGNLAFRQDGTVFVGNARLAADMAERREGWIASGTRDLGPDPAAAIVSPTRGVESTATLDLGGRTLKLRAWPPAHTGADLTVLDEKTGTLFTGDLVFRDRIPALDGKLDGWLAVIPELETVPTKIVVPGHGPVGHALAQDVAPEHGYLQTLRDDTCAYIGQGGDLAEAPARVMTRNARGWLLWTQHQPLNVNHAFIELQWKCF
ncbi:MAG: quinoprotein relay system zinc metallohydrolase 2 [Nevskiaceae bacterium]|nr:MAG: quinoprotein relay system zinc metallohydrolase 2 [Nevskiaceae bacterium]TBR73251.1 MAG: quinoprotein relay system zinc metallohydrolase 2 [Nevskiaceae bacterium]